MMLWQSLQRSRTRIRPRAELGKMHHSRAAFTMAIIGSTLGFGLNILSTTVGRGFGGNTAVALLIFSYGLLNWMLLSLCLAEKFRVYQDGLQYTDEQGRSRLLSWSEIAQVRMGRASTHLLLQDFDGHVVRVSVWLVGMPELASMVWENVDHTRITAKARSQLQQIFDEMHF
jgi:hypothetical protein